MLKSQLVTVFIIIIFIIARTRIGSIVQCHNKLMNDSAVPTFTTAADKLFRLGMVLAKAVLINIKIKQVPQTKY